MVESSLPEWLNYLIVVIIAASIASFGLYLFLLFRKGKEIFCKEHNAIGAILIGLISVFLGVFLSFLVITSWDFYSRTELDAQKEAQTLYILYTVIQQLPNTQNIQRTIIEYLEFIINVEFPEMRTGNVSQTGQRFIQTLQDQIYGYVPTTAQQQVLYQKAINLLDVAIDLRINRIYAAETGINSIIWFISIINAIILIVMTWFVNCENVFHYIFTSMITVLTVSSLFTASVLSFPYRGSTSIKPNAYITALNDIEKNNAII